MLTPRCGPATQLVAMVTDHRDYRCMLEICEIVALWPAACSRNVGRAIDPARSACTGARRAEWLS